MNRVSALTIAIPPSALLLDFIATLSGRAYAPRLRWFRPGPAMPRVTAQSAIYLATLILIIELSRLFPGETDIISLTLHDAIQQILSQAHAPPFIKANTNFYY